MNTPKRKLVNDSKRIKQIETILKTLQINSSIYKLEDRNEQKIFELIDEALTHTSAKKHKNHERLEFIGDAVLRLAASEFIEENFPKMKVGVRSELRAQLVSDDWLTGVGRSMNIKEILIIGPKAAGDIYACATLEAEATEALIGALYEYFRELEIIKKWLAPHWIKTSSKFLSDPHKQNPKSALQEWSQSKNNQLPIYETNEKSKLHGDPKRFFCIVHIAKQKCGEGWGRSRQIAEKEAAKSALEKIDNIEKI